MLVVHVDHHRHPDCSPNDIVQEHRVHRGASGAHRYSVPIQAGARQHLPARFDHHPREGRQYLDRTLAHQVCSTRIARHADTACMRLDTLPCREARGSACQAIMVAANQALPGQHPTVDHILFSYYKDRKVKIQILKKLSLAARL